jgi:type I restriction enzyme S subunit
VDHIDRFIFDEPLVLVPEDGGRFDEWETEPQAFYVNEKIWVNNHAHVLRARSEVRPQWLYFALLHRDLRRSLKGATRPKLNKADLNRIEIPVPPLHVQDAALVPLSRVASRIQTLCELLRVKRALVREMLTGRRRFPEFVAGNGWENVRIGDVAAERAARAGSESGPVYSCTKHRGLVPSLQYFGKQVFSRNLSSYKVVRRAEFAYATNHIEEGSIGLLEDCDFGLVSPMYTVFGVDCERVLPRFLYYVLKTEDYRQIFQRLTSGSVDRRGALRWSLFRTIALHLPPLDEQRRIARTLGAIDQEIALLEKLRDSYETEKRALMRRLLSGDVSLRAPAPAPTLVHA